MYFIFKRILVLSVVGSMTFSTLAKGGSWRNTVERYARRFCSLDESSFFPVWLCLPFSPSFFFFALAFFRPVSSEPYYIHIAPYMRGHFRTHVACPLEHFCAGCSPSLVWVRRTYAHACIRVGVTLHRLLHRWHVTSPCRGNAFYHEF